MFLLYIYSSRAVLRHLSGLFKVRLMHFNLNTKIQFLFEVVFLGRIAIPSRSRSVQVSSETWIVIRLSTGLFDNIDIKTLETMFVLAGNHLEIRTVYWLYCSSTLAFKDSNQHIRIGVCEITLSKETFQRHTIRLKVA